jgi:hypothetical protein
MSDIPQLTLERHIVEAWGLWWVQWQKAEKERLRRHTVSTQTRLKEFEEKHLKPGSESLLGNTATDPVNPLVLPPM